MIPGFDINLALTCARAIQDAYRGEVTLDNRLTDTQVLIRDLGTYPLSTLVALPGSASIRDWITNFESWKRNIKATEIHAGFDDAAESVFNPILENLTARPVPLAPVIICGHSLGGALAMVLAWKLNELGHPIQAVYTFGQPRVGDKDFVRDYNEELGRRTFRLVNKADIVPWLPPTRWPYSYRHTLTEVYLDGQQAIGGGTTATLLTELIDNSGELWSELRRGRAALLHDHALDAYIPSMEAAQFNAHQEEVKNA